MKFQAVVKRNKSKIIFIHLIQNFQKPLCSDYQPS
uniref:Uncharacterized protein n=1 Tax=Anguilla anguilla TaxID=7936 RepID=A0A0E9XLD8_ANGAN